MIDKLLYTRLDIDSPIFKLQYLTNMVAFGTTKYSKPTYLKGTYNY